VLLLSIGGGQHRRTSRLRQYLTITARITHIGGTTVLLDVGGGDSSRTRPSTLPAAAPTSAGAPVRARPRGPASDASEVGPVHAALLSPTIRRRVRPALGRPAQRRPVDLGRHRPLRPRARGRRPARRKGCPANAGVVLGPSVSRCHPSPMKASNRHSSRQRPRCHGRGRPALRGGHVRDYGALRAPGGPLGDDRRVERPGEHVPRGGLRRPRRPGPGGDRKLAVARLFEPCRCWLLTSTRFRETDSATCATRLAGGGDDSAVTVNTGTPSWASCGAPCLVTRARPTTWLRCWARQL
jgi:hypothetical protein